MRGNFFYERFGKSLAKFRKKTKLTQEEIAHRSGIDRTYYARIEEGRANPTIRILWRIAMAYEKKLCILLKDV